MTLPVIGAGGLIVLSWVVTARVLMTLSQRLGELRERVSFLEAKVNGKPT